LGQQIGKTIPGVLNVVSGVEDNVALIHEHQLVYPDYPCNSK